MPLVKINTPVHYHVKKYRICKNKICQGPVSCFDGNMVVSAGTSKEPVCPRVELIFKIIIILLIIFLGFIKSKPC